MSGNLPMLFFPFLRFVLTPVRRDQMLPSKKRVEALASHEAESTHSEDY